MIPTTSDLDKQDSGKTQQLPKQEPNVFTRVSFLAPLPPIALIFFCWLLESRHPELLGRVTVGMPIVYTVWGLLLIEIAALVTAFYLWRGSGKSSGQADSLEDVCLDEIDNARKKWKDQARRHRDMRIFWATFASLIAPGTVCCLAWQMIVVRQGFFAHTLIVAEVVVIVFALITVIKRNPTTKDHGAWIQARLRSELLRREAFLYLARVGPYLGADDKDHLLKITKQRVVMVEEQKPGASKNTELYLAELLNLEDRSDAEQSSWRDQLEAYYMVTEYPPALDNGFVHAYLTKRLYDQLDGYFRKKGREHNYQDQAYRILSLVALLLSCAVAVLHYRLVGAPAGTVEQNVSISALVLPPVGACFIALRTAFENHRLTNSYAHQEKQLEKLEYCFTMLDEKKHNPQTYDRDVKRLVLRTEELLSHEILRWLHIVGPESIQATG